MVVWERKPGQVLAHGQLEAAERGDDQARADARVAGVGIRQSAPDDHPDADQDHELGQREAAPRGRRALVDARPSGTPPRGRSGLGLGSALRVALAARGIALGTRAELTGALAAALTHGRARVSGG